MPDPSDLLKELSAGNVVFFDTRSIMLDMCAHIPTSYMMPLPLSRTSFSQQFNFTDVDGCRLVVVVPADPLPKYPSQDDFQQFYTAYFMGLSNLPPDGTCLSFMTPKYFEELVVKCPGVALYRRIRHPRVEELRMTIPQWPEAIGGRPDNIIPNVCWRTSQ